jgi:spermidine synthase
VAVTAEGLPAGVTTKGTTIGGGARWGVLVLNVAANAASAATEVKVKATATVDGKAIVREARPATVTWGIPNQQGNNTPVLGRLYSTEFYTLVSRALAPDGLMVVQSGSPYSTPDAYWRNVSTIESAGFAVTPYHVHVPTFGDWGFTLGRRGDVAPTPTMPKNAPQLRYLDQRVLDAATVFSPDIQPRSMAPSTLDHPRIVDDMRKGYT